MQNIVEIALETNIGFVTIDLLRNIAEIELGTNVGFVTSDSHTKYRRTRIGNEHRVCNHWVYGYWIVTGLWVIDCDNFWIP